MKTNIGVTEFSEALETGRGKHEWRHLRNVHALKFEIFVPFCRLLLERASPWIFLLHTFGTFITLGTLLYPPDI
jgi:hypothetical protein